VSATYEPEEGPVVLASERSTTVEGRKALVDKAREYIEEKPTTALVLGAAAGLLLALLLTRQSKSLAEAPERRRALYVAVDFQSLIERVALEFERQYGMPVEQEARIALIVPALPHKNGVEEDLRTGKVTMNFLEECVLGILKRARKFADQRNKTHIDREAVQQSMHEDCPYIGWC
jgi:hypothetical protein